MSGESKQYIPDPIELGERRVDRYIDSMEGDNIRCVDCKRMVPISSVVMMSPNPDGPPVCEACAKEAMKTETDQSPQSKG